MPPSLHPSLHTKECNILIALLEKCQSERKYMQVFGACNDHHYAVAKCIAKERADIIAENGKKYRAKKIRNQKNEEAETKTA